MNKEQQDAILFLRDLKNERIDNIGELERSIGESPSVREYIENIKEADFSTGAKQVFNHGKDFARRVGFGGLTGAGIGTIRATGDNSNPLETPSDKLKRFGRSALEGGLYGSTIGGASKLVELGALRNKTAGVKDTAKKGLEFMKNNRGSFIGAGIGGTLAGLPQPDNVPKEDRFTKRLLNIGSGALVGSLFGGVSDISRKAREKFVQSRNIEHLFTPKKQDWKINSPFKDSKQQMAEAEDYLAQRLTGKEPGVKHASFLSNLKPLASQALQRGGELAKANPNLATTLGMAGAGAAIGGIADGSMSGALMGGLGGAALGAGASYGRAKSIAGARAPINQASIPTTKNSPYLTAPTGSNPVTQAKATVQQTASQVSQAPTRPGVGQYIDKNLKGPREEWMYNGAGLDRTLQGPKQTSVYSRGENPLVEANTQFTPGKTQGVYDGNYNINTGGVQKIMPLSSTKTRSTVAPNFKAPKTQLASELQGIKMAFLNSIGKSLSSPVNQGLKNTMNSLPGINTANSIGTGTNLLSGGQKLKPGKLSPPSQSTINPSIPQPG